MHCALQQGRITQRTYDRVVNVWAGHLDGIKRHQPSLIHYSAFLWTIYLDREHGAWRVAKFTSLGDVMRWDPAYDLACLRFPPFGQVSPARWNAFLRGYGPAPPRKRVLLYALMQRLCAAMGSYWEPPTAQARAWAQSCLTDLDVFMDEIEKTA